MSFEERVIKRTNQLIIKNSGNLKRFQNKHNFISWYNEGLYKNDLQVGKVGETYGELYLIRASKAALKKNRPKIRELNQLLKRKKGSIATIEELSNFIGFMVTKYKPEANEVVKSTNNPSLHPSRFNANTIINDNDIDGLSIMTETQTHKLDNWEDNNICGDTDVIIPFNNNKKKPENNDMETLRNQLNLPSVDNWEDL